MIVWTAKDAGCYGSGEFGHQHVRGRMADLLQGVRTFEVPELCAVLRGPASDDASEEYEALALLQVRTDEARWGLIDGDLMLVADEP